MCGLVGVIAKNKNGLFKKQIEIFCALLYIDYLRGQDSTGVFCVDREGDVRIAKEASTPSEFMQTDEFNALMRWADRQGSALIGHNRKATRGDVTDENAHPFWVEDKIVLVHNGTMYGDHKKHAEVEVDSHAIAHILSENATVDEALKSFDAAYALIWYDVLQKKLHAVRNSQRPLWWVETGSEWILSSEKSMLEFVMKRYEVVSQKGPIEFTTNDLQMWTLQNGGGWNASYRSLDLVKKSQESDDIEWGNMMARRMQKFNNGWDDEYRDDIPFDVARRSHQHILPNPTRAANEKKLEDGLVQVETNVMNMHSHDFETGLAKQTNKVIPNGQFYADIVKRYPKGNKVMAFGFEYAYANFKDSSSGFHLYLQVHDDPDLICRMWLDEKAGEARVADMAATNWVYELEINRKWWCSFERISAKTPTTPGYVIMECTSPKLVYGGGMGDERWFEKLTSQVVRH